MFIELYRMEWNMKKTTSYKDMSESQRFAESKIFMFNSYYKMMICTILTRWQQKGDATFLLSPCSCHTTQQRFTCNTMLYLAQYIRIGEVR